MESCSAQAPLWLTRQLWRSSVITSNDISGLSMASSLPAHQSSQQSCQDFWLLLKNIMDWRGASKWWRSCWALWFSSHSSTSPCSRRRQSNQGKLEDRSATTSRGRSSISITGRRSATSFGPLLCPSPSSATSFRTFTSESSSKRNSRALITIWRLSASVSRPAWAVYFSDGFPIGQESTAFCCSKFRSSSLALWRCVCRWLEILEFCWWSACHSVCSTVASSLSLDQLHMIYAVPMVQRKLSGFFWDYVRSDWQLGHRLQASSMMQLTLTRCHSSSLEFPRLLELPRCSSFDVLMKRNRIVTSLKSSSLSTTCHKLPGIKVSGEINEISLYRINFVLSENGIKALEERRATLAGPGINSHLLKSHNISILVVETHNENLRRYAYSYLWFLSCWSAMRMRGFIEDETRHCKSAAFCLLKLPTVQTKNIFLSTLTCFQL